MEIFKKKKKANKQNKNQRKKTQNKTKIIPKKPI